MNIELAIMELTLKQRQTLAALIGAFIPAESTLIPTELEERISTIQAMISSTTPKEQQDFKQLLDLLGGRIATWIWAGKGKPFTELPKDRQIRLLQSWSNSRMGLMRKAFGTLKKLCLFTHYGLPTADQQPWNLAHYPGPLLAPIADAEKRIQVSQAEAGKVVDCDVLVIGSGAGGGIAAGILAEAGHHVIIVEKGGYLEGNDFNDRETDMVRATYDSSGALVTQNGSVGIFAGSCLGGGTTINWNASFLTPGYVLEEWHRDHGLDFAMSSDYSAHGQAVAASIGVNGDHSTHSPQNQALFDGSVKLGRKVSVIDRNVQGCHKGGLDACGYCSMGCRQGNKQSTAKTWIRRAVDRGAQVYVHTAAQKITYVHGKVTGAVLQQQRPGSAPVQFQVRAKRVVLAAGSIHSPALLLRSGIDHGGIGRHLYFHPTVAVAGFYDQPMDPWYGPMMTAVDKQDMHLDGNYGYWIETPPVHPGMASLALPWESPSLHQADMARIKHMATFVVLTRDQFGGRVRLDRKGNTQITYDLHPYDRQHMLKGIRAAFDIHRAEGAYETVFPHGQHTRYKIRTSKVSADAYLGGMKNWGWKANQFALFTAHQMGTCAMGGDPAEHPFMPSGESRSVKGLFIADGSALPSSAGVNPMLSIMALAGWVAKGMPPA